MEKIDYVNFSDSLDSSTILLKYAERYQRIKTGQQAIYSIF